MPIALKNEPAIIVRTRPTAQSKRARVISSQTLAGGEELGGRRGIRTLLDEDEAAESGCGETGDTESSESERGLLDWLLVERITFFSHLKEQSGSENLPS
jgi:hypothetical protein